MAIRKFLRRGEDVWVGSMAGGMRSWVGRGVKEIENGVQGHGHAWEKKL
jgi:hypothetical protein